MEKVVDNLEVKDYLFGFGSFLMGRGIHFHHGQIQHFQKNVIRRKHRFGFGDLSELTVKSLDGIGSVD